MQELSGLGSTAGLQNKRCQGQRGDVLTTLHMRILAGSQSLRLRSEGFVAERVKVARMENRQVTAGETAQQREKRMAGSKS